MSKYEMKVIKGAIIMRKFDPTTNKVDAIKWIKEVISDSIDEWLSAAIEELRYYTPWLLPESMR